MDTEELWFLTARGAFSENSVDLKWHLYNFSLGTKATQNKVKVK